MRLRYSFGFLALITFSLFLVVNFTNCAGPRQQSDEYGEYIFNDYASCVKGKLCESPEEIMCYDPEQFFELSPGTVCNKSSIAQ